MTRSWIPTVFGAVVLSASAFAGGDDPKAENPLFRPPGAPDGDASGHVRVEIDLDKNRHRLKIEAEHIDTSLVFEAWIADAGSTLQFTGVMPFNAVNEVEIEFDTDEGPPLPFATTNVKTLAGRAVEVRSGGLTYLVGTVPSLDGSGDPGGPGGSGGNGFEVKQYLVRPPGSPDSDVKGYVELRKKSAGDQKFKVEAEHVDTAVSFSVWLETAVGSGTMQNVGAMPVNGINEVELEIETEDGQPLPFGVSDVSQFAGMRVEVRDAANAVYLAGIVPAIGGGPVADTAQKTIPGTLGGNVRVKLEKKKASQRFGLQAKKLKGFAAADVYVEDPASGLLQLVDQIDLNGGGNGDYAANTKKGQALPLGVSSLADLAGRAIELRDSASGTILATGKLPKF